MFIPKKTCDLVYVRNLWTDLFDSPCPVHIYYRLLWNNANRQENWQGCLSSKRKADAILVYTLYFLYAFYWIYFTCYVIQINQAKLQPRQFSMHFYNRIFNSDYNKQLSLNQVSVSLCGRLKEHLFLGISYVTPQQINSNQGLYKIER